MDGKVLRGSYNRSTNASTTDSHPAIQLVTVYVVERGLILPIQPVDCKSNEIKALPPVIKELAQRGVVFAFDAINTQKSGCNRAEVSSACVAPSKLANKSLLPGMIT